MRQPCKVTPDISDVVTVSSWQMLEARAQITAMILIINSKRVHLELETSFVTFKIDVGTLIVQPRI